MIVKVKEVHTIKNEEWQHLYKALKELTLASKYMNNDDYDSLLGYIEQTRVVAMNLIETNNYVVITKHPVGVLGDITFLELDYLYNGKPLNVDEIFREDGNYFVKIR